MPPVHARHHCQATRIYANDKKTRPERCHIIISKVSKFAYAHYLSVTQSRLMVRPIVKTTIEQCKRVSAQESKIYDAVSVVPSHCVNKVAKKDLAHDRRLRGSNLQDRGRVR